MIRCKKKAFVRKFLGYKIITVIYTVATMQVDDDGDKEVSYNKVYWVYPLREGEEINIQGTVYR